MAVKKTTEVNFDGLVGPTHNYSGLSFGNVASLSNKALSSNPREAALQGLKKMKFLHDLGIKQAILPPHERPHLKTLKRLGFSGSTETILRQASQQAPEVLSAIWSASSMWTANAATVAPSVDTEDHKVHFTPANLISMLHRSIESGFTSKILKFIFPEGQSFAHHKSLLKNKFFGDEGAANHTRFCQSPSQSGIHFFIYGKNASLPSNSGPKLFPARQTLQASMAIARLHKLNPNQVIFAQQNPAAIDAGVFHNDVISVGNENTFFYHSDAFVDTRKVMSSLKKHYQAHTDNELLTIEVKPKDIPLDLIVKSYLFNSQLITTRHSPKEMMLLAPTECEENKTVREYLKSLIQDSSQPIRRVYFYDLKQSMRNGGGPACLRLRVVLTDEEIEQSHPSIYFSEPLYQRLCKWVNKHYRDRLTPNDLLDPVLVNETRSALDELTSILKLGSIYRFQN